MLSSQKRVSRRRRGERLPLRAGFRPFLEVLEDRTLLTTFFVTSTGDTGAGEGTFGDLRYCITRANSAGGSNTIQFNLSGTIALAQPLPTISDPGLTIAGPGAAQLTIQGDHGFGMLAIGNGATATIRDLTFAGGNAGASGLGGAIHNLGSLTLANTTFTGNSAFEGGAIDNDGTLTIQASTFTNNSATVGGAIFNDVSLSVSGSTFASNAALHDGGALYNLDAGATFSNCTFDSNVANTEGGGIANFGQLTLTQSTLTRNHSPTGGGLFTTSDPQYAAVSTFWNTLVAGNSANSGPDVNGPVQSHGHNLIGASDQSTGWGPSDQTGTAAHPIDGRLSPLQNEGGPTATVALLPGSPAIDAGDDNAVLTQETDQRGRSRQVDGNGSGSATVDIGAFEVQLYQVTNTADSGQGSLRQAILDANADGSSRLAFQIGEGYGGSATIQPHDQGNGVSLPVITQPVFVDGWSQGGAGYTGPPLIVLDGSQASTSGLGTFGLNIQAPGVVVRGLAIENYAAPGGNGFAIGIFANAPTVRGAWIYGNYLGTDLSGTSAAPNGQGGIWIGANANGNTIGAAAAGNLISGNAGEAALLVESLGNSIVANRIGTNAAGTAALPNAGTGILVTGGANTIGGPVTWARNLLAGNDLDGVAFMGPGATGNLLLGNFVGTDAAGMTALANRGDGVEVTDGASGNTIASNVLSGNLGVGVLLSGVSGNTLVYNFVGTDAAGHNRLGNDDAGVLLAAGATGNTIGIGNVISANGQNGVEIDGSNGNLIARNLIGTDLHGMSALGNGATGILLRNGASGNTISAGNVISGNQATGIAFDGADRNLVLGNFIGTTIAGTHALPNAAAGIALAGNDNTIGGTASGTRNLISGNGGDGIKLEPEASGNLVLGNFIGTDILGISALANQGDGILVVAAAGNTLGGLASGAANLISGNAANGVEFNQAGSNVLIGNYVGTGVLGKTALANGFDGVLFTAVSGSILDHNVISGNAANGVEINGSVGNLLRGNLVGTNASGTAAVGNGQDGVLIGPGGVNNTIGAGNVLSGNPLAGLELKDGGNLVVGSRLGTDAAGKARLPNSVSGLLISGNSNTIGGTAPGAGNLISGNNGPGAQLYQTASDNQFLGNFIGTNATGMTALPNSGSGIFVFLSTITGNTIGGTTPGSRNLISGNSLSGVEISSSSHNVVEGNFIGSDVSGVHPLGNGSDGVFLTTGARFNTIGGTAAGAGNTITGNLRGVDVFGTSTTEDAILGNSIFGNRKLGIDLGADGVTPNDPQNIGTPGPNKLQNFPVLQYALTNGVVTRVAGSVAGRPKSTLRLEFFDDPTGSTDDFGQGQIYLGSVSVNVGTLGLATFDTSNLPAAPVNSFISATATDQDGNTSEFAANVVVTAPRAVFEVSAPATAIQGAPVNVKVTAMDPYGNVVAGYQGTVVFKDDRGTILATASFPTDFHGQHEFPLVLQRAGAQIITVSDATNPVEPGVFAIGVQGGPPAISINVPSEAASSGVVIHAGEPLNLTGQFEDVAVENWTASVDYGDGSGLQPLPLTGKSFLLNHQYAQEGDYYLTVRVQDQVGDVGSERLVMHVLVPLVNASNVDATRVDPGQTGSVSVSGVTATLAHDGTSADSAYLLVAVVPVPVAATQGLPLAVTTPTAAASYDVRAFNTNPKDTVTAVFSYPSSPTPPTITFFDRATGTFEQVTSSSRFPAVIDPVAHTITITFDQTSTPSIGELKGTIFTLSVVQVQPVLPPITPAVQVARAQTTNTTTDAGLADLPPTASALSPGEETLALSPSQSGAGREREAQPGSAGVDVGEIQNILRELLNSVPYLSSNVGDSGREAVVLSFPFLEATMRTFVGQLPPPVPVVPANGQPAPERTPVPEHSATPPPHVQPNEEPEGAPEALAPELAAPTSDAWSILFKGTWERSERPALSTACAILGGVLLAGSLKPRAKSDDERPAAR